MRHVAWLWEIWKWGRDITAQRFFNLIIAVATGFIAWFNFQLGGVTDEMKKATDEAAQAAKQSARAADLALKAERPYLLIDRVRPRIIGSEGVPAMAEV